MKYRKYATLLLGSIPILATLLFMFLLLHTEIMISIPTGLFLLLFIFISSFIFLYFIRQVQYIWKVAYFLYIVVLCYFLFFSKEFTRDFYNFPNLSDYGSALQLQWSTMVNLKPFASIHNMLLVYNNPFYGYYSFINLYGNLLIFSPFAFFTKLFHPKMRFFKFFIIMSAYIIAAEFIQFFTFTGSLDIDDYILNIIGACCTYCLLHSPILKKQLNRLHPSKK